MLSKYQLLGAPAQWDIQMFLIVLEARSRRERRRERRSETTTRRSWAWRQKNFCNLFHISSDFCFLLLLKTLFAAPNEPAKVMRTRRTRSLFEALKTSSNGPACRETLALDALGTRRLQGRFIACAIFWAFLFSSCLLATRSIDVLNDACLWGDKRHIMATRTTSD